MENQLEKQFDFCYDLISVLKKCAKRNEQNSLFFDFILNSIFFLPNSTPKRSIDKPLEKIVCFKVVARKRAKPK